MITDDSSFYFHAGIFQLPVSGITHMCSGNGKADPPHPACPTPLNGTTPKSSRWSASTQAIILGPIERRNSSDML